MSASWSLQDAKNRFSAVVAAAKREPQTVTKHGKPAVVVVDAAEFARLRALEVLHAPSFIEHLLAIPKGDWELERLEFEPRDVDF
jgi:prevent-host-death family protein